MKGYNTEKGYMGYVEGTEWCERRWKMIVLSDSIRIPKIWLHI